VHTFALVIPDQRHLAGFRAALEPGWSPDNPRDHAAAEEILGRISGPRSRLRTSRAGDNLRRRQSGFPEGYRTQRRRFVEAFRAPPALGGHQTLRFRIRVAEQTSR
jgi:hypothetical protein